MSSLQDQVGDHDFDGIQEFDNHLPNWWLWSFYLACIFSVGYWVSYHIFGFTDLPAGEYAAQMTEYRLEKERQAANQPLNEETLQAMATEEVHVEAGRAIFIATCSTCHYDDARGNIGPNLTDKFWLHGGKAMDIYTTISKGYPDKGMVAWEPTLGLIRCMQATAFVLSIKNTNAANGKAPQGEEEK